MGICACVTGGYFFLAHAQNSGIVEMDWLLGSRNIQKEREPSWGSAFVERLYRNLSFEFPDMKGFSRRNLYLIRQLYLFYSSLSPNVPQAMAQIPWEHNRLIISKINNSERLCGTQGQLLNTAGAEIRLGLKLIKRISQAWKISHQFYVHTPCPSL